MSELSYEVVWLPSSKVWFWYGKSKSGQKRGGRALSQEQAHAAAQRVLRAMDQDPAERPLNFRGPRSPWGAQ